METFIELVRRSPELWNPLHRDYHNIHVKNKAWQNVIKLCNDKSISNIEIAKVEWKKLRDNHRDALKRAKLGKNKLLPPCITKWKYAKAMQFLEPHMKYRITENVEVNPVISVQLDQDELIEEDVKHTSKRIRTDSTGESTSTTLQQNGDALETFFYSILKSTRDMPLWMQTQVKKKIFAVIIDAEEQLMSTTEPTYDEKNESESIENQIKLEVFSENSSASDII